MSERRLDEKRISLLINMSYHLSCVCSKAIQAPLLRRGLVKQVRPSTYVLTRTGKAMVKGLVEEYNGQRLLSYGGISIGGKVMIVDSPRKDEQESQG